jgi:putative ABC transport system substrate-binding protein
MRRRAFIAAAYGVLAWPLCVMAQPMKRVPRLCFLTFDPGTAQSPAKRFESFFERLRELGYVNRETITIDYLHPDGRSDRYPELAAECLRLRPDIIAVTTTPGAHALKNATSTVPIVMVALGDPVGTKLVDSLSRPGGNITGMSQMTSGLAAKRLELLKEAVPGLSRVLVLAYLVDPISPLQVEALKEAAPLLDVTPYVIDIKTPDDLPAAFEAVENGGLMAYDVSDRDLHRSAADYVDKVLKGAKPSDLPVQQPSRFHLVINLKTAKALGLTLPPTLVATADEVIE